MVAEIGGGESPAIRQYDYCSRWSWGLPPVPLTLFWAGTSVLSSRLIAALLSTLRRLALYPP
jgi:hypothetical protein